MKPSELVDWMLSQGINTITSEECAYLFGVPKKEVSQRLTTLRRKNALVSVAKGLWVAVSPELRAMGAPEPLYYIDTLLKHYDCNYCVGWLSAAALQGASHQAPQVFQVAADKMLRDRVIGRSRLKFYDRSYISSLKKKRITTTAGTVWAASPGATMLMVASDLILAAGIDNAATIITELAEEHPDYMKDVRESAGLFPVTAVCRLGWMLEHIADEHDLEELERVCRSKEAPAFLSPYGSKKGSLNKRWNIIENRKIEADV